jgi:hypothetical protein
MQLVDYPGLFHKWPPPARRLSGECVSLKHCLDTIVLVFTKPSSEANCLRIRILTEFRGVLWVREIPRVEGIFARVFCDFLNKHLGTTIRGIGKINASFLG